jgi:hypothetical protein
MKINHIGWCLKHDNLFKEAWVEYHKNKIISLFKDLIKLFQKSNTEYKWNDSHVLRLEKLLFKLIGKADYELYSIVQGIPK